MADAKIDFQVNYDTKGAEKNIKGLNKSLQGIAATAAVAFATKGVIDFTKSSLEAAKTLEATEAKFTTVFGEFTDDAQGFIDEFQKLTPASEAVSRNIASGIQDLLVPMGFAREEATGMTEDTLKLVGALTNMNSATHTSAQVGAAFQSALVGNHEGLRSLGVVTSAEAINQKVLALGLDTSTMQAEKQAKATALLQIAYEQSGDALAAYNKESLDTQTKTELMKAQFEDARAELGMNLLPIFSDLVTILSENVIPAISTLANWISEHKQLAGALAIGLTTLGTIFGVLTTVVGTFGVALSAAIWPVTLIVAGIAALIAIGILLVKNWDKITEWFGKFWQGVKDLFKKGVDFIMDMFYKFSPLGIIIKNFDKIKAFFTDFLTNAKMWGQHLIQGFIDGVMSKFTALKNGVKKVAQTVKDFLGFTVPDKGPLSDFNLSGKHMMEGYAKGIKQNQNLVENASRGVATGIASGFNPNGNSTTVNVNNTGTADAVNSMNGMSSKQVSLLLEQNTLLKQLVQKPVAKFNDKDIYNANRTYTKSLGVPILGV